MSEKVKARDLVKDAIGLAAKGGADIFVRINHDTIEEDLEAVVWPGLKRIVYPKAETGQEIRDIDEILTRLELTRGIASGSIEIGANVETALGVINAFEIVAASPRIKDFGGGGGYDMSRDFGVEMFVDFDQFVYGKGELELAARVEHLDVIATPFLPNPSGSVSDPDHALRLAQATYNMGFHIGGGLHPNVVEPSNKGFTPTSKEITTAIQDLEFFDHISDEGLPEGRRDGRLIDRYEAKRAQSMLTWANACDEKNTAKLEALEQATEAADD
ncbi:hypothetical protein FIM12_08240 [SAR202 cluster bacterium AD-804-J14_MRT_500m]|nr:hypothetical protein [SAR202 cluster bacterium AD-804-J14_MRT_500m]